MPLTPGLCLTSMHRHKVRETAAGITVKFDYHGKSLLNRFLHPFLLSLLSLSFSPSLPLSLSLSLSLISFLPNTFRQLHGLSPLRSCHKRFIFQPLRSISSVMTNTL